jgi:ABC-type sugar transport system substrate-binding protein
MLTRLLARLIAPICMLLAQPHLAAAAEEPLRIGLIVPLTGGQASTGKQLANAVKL